MDGFVVSKPIHCVSKSIREDPIGDLPPISWTPGYATAALASNSAGDR